MEDRLSILFYWLDDIRGSIECMMQISIQKTVKQKKQTETALQRKEENNQFSLLFLLLPAILVYIFFFSFSFFLIFYWSTYFKNQIHLVERNTIGICV